MKFEIISKIAAFLVSAMFGAALAVLITGCAHYPKLKDFPEGTSNVCIRYERCLYYSAVGKVKLDCSVLEAKCAKADIFLDYKESKEELPMVYDKAGEHQMTFQEYWDKRD